MQQQQLLLIVFFDAPWQLLCAHWQCRGVTALAGKAGPAG
jgi:hypothetical protein